MDKKDFKKLSQVQKLLLIMESGRLVLEKKEPNRVLKLYVYNLFYVEIIYNIEKNKVVKISLPEMNYIVDEYLDVLNVDDILDL